MVVMFKILRLELSVVNRSRSSVRNPVFFVSNKYLTTGSVTQQLFLSRVRRRYLGTNKSIVFQGNPAMPLPLHCLPISPSRPKSLSTLSDNQNPLFASESGRLLMV